MDVASLYQAVVAYVLRVTHVHGAVLYQSACNFNWYLSSDGTIRPWGKTMEAVQEKFII